MAYLTTAQLKTLSDFLDATARPVNTMTLHEVRGFLWAVASTPTDIAIDDWLPFVFEGDDANFADDAEEETITNLFFDLLDEQYQRIEDDDSELSGSDYHWHEAEEQRWPLTAWCSGLLKAHYWQEEAWNTLLEETEPVETEDGMFDIVEEVDSTLSIAALFADIAGALEDSEESAEIFLASMAEIAEQLPWIMMNYAECGCLLSDMLQEPQEPYRREQPKIGRNDPCFCGSGKKYKNCCIHAANDD
ncbi:MAG TPA: UPF0149 family protein [Pseudomonadales bacterium]|nr:UPF0149 family protein [Pseudomonadales bacterium]